MGAFTQAVRQMLGGGAGNPDQAGTPSMGAMGAAATSQTGDSSRSILDLLLRRLLSGGGSSMFSGLPGAMGMGFWGRNRPGMSPKFGGNQGNNNSGGYQGYSGPFDRQTFGMGGQGSGQLQGYASAPPENQPNLINKNQY